jgi:hypothetical protein
VNADKDFGYVKQSRKQFQGDDLLWDDGSPFDSRSAWMWLIQAAAWKDSVYHSRSRMDMLNRGEFVASYRFLGARWGWGKNRVRTFIALLSRKGRIVHTRKGQHGHIYLIVNYDLYQSSTNDSGTLRPMLNGTANGTVAGQSRDKVEGSKEVKAYTTDFEVFWQRYPKRAGSNPKARAARAYGARLSEGHTKDSIMAGEERMAACIRAEKNEGTRYVLQAATFLGPDLRFLEPWEIAKSNGKHPPSERGFVLE